MRSSRRGVVSFAVAALVVLGGVGAAVPAWGSDPVTNDLVAVSDTRLDFGALPFGSAAVTMQYSITAMQRIFLESGSELFEDLGPTDPWVQVGSGACAGYEGSDIDPRLTLEPGDVCTISVTFRPSAQINNVEGVIPTGPQWIAQAVSTGAEVRVGVGYYAANPSIRVQPQDIDFGSLRPGQTSAPRMVTVTNLATVPIDMLQFTPISRAEFTQTTACTVPIPVGGSCTAEFTFSPVPGEPDLDPTDTTHAHFTATGTDGPRTYDQTGFPVRLHGLVDLTPPPNPVVDIAVTVGTRIPAGLVAGGPVLWDYTVTNHGPDPSGAFSFSVVYDDSVLVMDGQMPAECVEIAPALYDCTIELAVGETTMITLPTRIADTAPPGSMLAAEGTSFNPWDPNFQNNVAFLEIGPTITPLADLTASIIPSSATPNPGASFDWVLTVTNNGPTAATAVTATMTIPTGTTIDTMPPTCTATATVVSCTLGDMLPTDTTVLPITLTLSPTAPGGVPLESVLTVTSTTPDPDPDNNTAISQIIPPTVTAPNPTPTPTPSPSPTPPSPEGGLAATGADATPATLAAAAFLIGGLTLLLIRRTTTTRTRHT